MFFHNIWRCEKRKVSKWLSEKGGFLRMTGRGTARLSSSPVPDLFLSSVAVTGTGHENAEQVQPILSGQSPGTAT